MTAPLAFIDTETTGVHPGREPWEVAIIRREPDGTETTWHAFVGVDLSAADPFGLKVGGFYDRHPRGRFLSGARASEPSPGELAWRSTAAREIARHTHGAHLVGAVPNFDSEVFERLLREHGYLPGWHYHLIDVEALAVGFLASSADPAVRALAAPPWKSDALTAALDLDPVPEDERHTALGDARWAQRIYDRILGGSQ